MIRHILKSVMAIMIAITLIACTKFGKNITVKGRVLNPITNEGVEGITVELIRSKYLQYSGGFKEVKHTTTNQNGEFEMSAYHAGAVLAQVQAPAEYYDLGWLHDGKYYFRTVVKKGKITQIDYHLVSYGKIKVSVHNINCQGENDTLIYKRLYTSFPNIDVFQPFTLTGCYNNEGAYAEVPSGDYKIEWTVIRNGVSNTYSHILTVPGNGQASYNIEY